LDTRRTSREWAEASPSLCVLPVGACEQHSHHLPLASDALQATYFGDFLAREFGAALLPTLNYGNSLEHTGFKGTITLRPETLMQIVRDLADEVEGQGFTTMIVMNGHGGNFALGPAVRDINRRNRKLKILIVDFWIFVDAALLEGCPPGMFDIHANEFETSLMLALHPDLVGPARPDIRQAVEGFKQPDLNTFGMGFVAPGGACGMPSKASRAKGEKIVESIKKNMLPHVRQRLDWLAKNRTYSGKGMDTP